MLVDWTFYLAAIPAVILVGLSKGGFSGLSMMAMPLLSLAVSPVQAAAIMLPILIVQDWVSVWAFRRDFEPRNLLILIPASLIGIGAGWMLYSDVSEALVRLAVGVISIGFVAYMVIRSRGGEPAPSQGKVAPGIFWGALAGFTSFVSHAGSPPFQVYVMPQGLSPRLFAGTAVMVFAAINLLKVIPYFALGQFSRENLMAAATLFPLAILATMAGVWLVRRVPADRFYNLVYAMTFLIGLRLVWVSLSEILS
ncbi:sulfite exporter TauE/SafE family protein [Methylocapsa sp. S129]|uniref:sulfite exporter TauE/SafE family protein n=1 Tax=Methylocapsa sp. S129 TaxID=1641869 RepID=UPI00131AE198|nr:sulfite exporter TauE/SafE family protein [Methylocapsa sp. S129]